MKNKSLAEVESRTELTIVTPAEMLQSAIQSGMDPDGIEKLANLYERFQANAARIVFANAMVSFQSECPTIVKNRTVDTGKYKYMFADFPQVTREIKPYCEKYGFSYRFNSSMTDAGYLRAICTVTHSSGHSESSSFDCPFGAGSPTMNDAQKQASALSYAKRYALVQAFGLSTDDIDDDASSLRGEVITKDQALDLQAKLEETNTDLSRFLKWVDVPSLDAIPATRYSAVLGMVEQKAKRN